MPIFLLGCKTIKPDTSCARLPQQTLFTSRIKSRFGINCPGSRLAASLPSSRSHVDGGVSPWCALGNSRFSKPEGAFIATELVGAAGGSFRRGRRRIFRRCLRASLKAAADEASQEAKSACGRHPRKDLSWQLQQDSFDQKLFWEFLRKLYGFVLPKACRDQSLEEADTRED
eukprot:s6615_g2.t1